jgi:hypothetical protein
MEAHQDLNPNQTGLGWVELITHTKSVCQNRHWMLCKKEGQVDFEPALNLGQIRLQASQTADRLSGPMVQSHNL